MAILTCPACGQKNRVPDTPAITARCGRCKAALGSGAPVTLTDSGFDTEIGGAPAAVVDFWAAWCGPCRIVAPLIEELATRRPDLLVGKLNVDENQATSSRYRVSSIPTMIFFRNGQEAGRLVGAVDRAALDRAIAQHLG